MKKFIVAVLLLGFIVLTTPPISAAIPSSGHLSIGETTVVTNGLTITSSGPGWTYNNRVLTLHDYHGPALAATDMGEFTVALAPGTTNMITESSNASGGAGISVGENTILIIQGAIGATLNVMGSGMMETGIYGASDTADIIFTMANININRVNNCILSHGSVELQNSTTLVSRGLQVGVCLSGAPLTVNRSALNSNGAYKSIMIDNHTLTIENSSTVTALSTNGDGINVINGALLIDHSTVTTTGATAINAMGGLVLISNASEVAAVSGNGDGIYADRGIDIRDSNVEAVGGGQCGLFSFGAISITGSLLAASSPGGISILADTGDVNISGGTISAPEGVSANAITLTGGSLNAPSPLVIPQPVDGQGRPVLKTSIVLPGLSADQPVAEITCPPDDYEVTGMVTDNDGMIYPWLSADSTVITVTAGEQQFVGQISGGSSGSLMPTAAMAPSITFAHSTLVAGKGSSASLTITATGNPAPTFSAVLANGDPLPSWITLGAQTGRLTATPISSLVPGNYVVRVTATNSVGSVTKDITIRVEEVPPTGDGGVIYFAGLSALFALLALCSMAIWRSNAWGQRRKT